eukprot:891890-Prorocentrum_minimum.AAC.1
MFPAVDIELVAMERSMKIISRALIHTRPVRVDIRTSIGLPIRVEAKLLTALPPEPPAPPEFLGAGCIPNAKLRRDGVCS